MHLVLAARRSVAVAAATALLTTGGIAGGLLSSAALAAPGDPVVTSATPAAANNTASVPVTINGSSFVPTSDYVLFAPTFTAAVALDGLTANPDTTTSTATALKIVVPATLAGPGDYDVYVKRKVPGGADISSTKCAKCFTITSNGPPSVSGSVPGASTGTTDRGPLALDINGSFFAKGAFVSFLKTDGTKDAGLTFSPGDPNNTATQGYIADNLIRGNYDNTTGTPFTPGKHMLKVVNTDGQTGGTGEFWQPTFAGSAVSPNTLGQGAQSRTVTVTGQGIRQGSRLGIQTLNTSGAADVTVGTATVSADGTTISAPVSVTSGASTAARSVTVSGPDGGAFTVAGAFHVATGPTVTSMNTTALGQGASVDVTINGTGFATGSTTSTRPVFTFSGTGVTGVTKSATATAAVVTMTVLSDATPGGRTVTVTNPDGGSSTLGQDPVQMTYPLTIDAGPVATSVSPASSPAGTTKNVVIQGTGFDATNGMTVMFAVPPATGASRTSDPTMSVGAVTVTAGASGAKDTATFSVTIAAGAPSGLRDIVLTNTGDFGSYVCAGCFGIDSLSVSPTAASNTAAIRLTFTRSGLVAGSSVELVRAGDPSYQPHLKGSAPTVTSTGMSALLDLTNAAPGPYNAIVTSGSATYSCSSCFTVTGSTPTLSSLSPNSGGQGAVNRAVTLTGSSFSRGEQVTIAGLKVHDVTFVSPTQLTAQIDIPAGTATGAKDVKVTNADGQGTSTLTGGYTVNAAPTVTTVSPASLGQGAKQQNITVTGPGFVTGATGQPSSTVDFGPGITVTKVVVTQGTATLPPPLGTDPDDTLVATVDIAEGAATTLRDVKVTNPDGGVGTLVKGFTVNPGPKVTGIAPTALVPGAPAKTLTITGTGFSTTSGKTAVPTIAGVTLSNPTVAPDGKTITVTGVVSSGTAKGLRDVVVTNPTDQGVGTCASCFVVASPPGAPRNVAAQLTSAGSVLVSWAAPADNGGSPVTSYVVSAKSPDGKAAGSTSTVDGATTSATLSGFTAATTYTVSVIARNAAGDSAAGTADTGPAVGAPLAPATVVGYPQDAQVVVYWSAANAQGKPVTEYTVRSSDPAVPDVVVDGSQTGAVIPNLTNGTSYTFAVKAKNEVGYGAFSAASAAVTPKFGTRLTSVRTQATSVAGTRIGYSGRLTRTKTGAAISGVTVAVTLRPDVGATKVVTVTTDGNGAWAFTASPVYNTLVNTRYDGDSTQAVASAAAYKMGVSPRIAVSHPKSGATSSTSSVVVINGLTSPNKAGRQVTLYRVVSGGRLQALARATVASNGTYGFSVKPPYGNYTLKVGIGGSVGNIGGYSSSFVVKRR